MTAIAIIKLDSNIFNLKLYEKTPHYNRNNFITDFLKKWLKIKIFKKTLAVYQKMFVHFRYFLYRIGIRKSSWTFFNQEICAKKILKTVIICNV